MEKKEKIEIGIMGVYAIFIAVLLGLLAWNSVALKEIQENTNDLEDEMRMYEIGARVNQDLLMDLYELHLKERDYIYDNYPNDEAEADFIDNTSIRLEYYDNRLDHYNVSPIFTIENWTELPKWSMEQHPDTFTQHQKNFILLITSNMAYYKETGTWLGE